MASYKFYIVLYCIVTFCQKCNGWTCGHFLLYAAAS